ncbi:MAG: YicC family protein [Bacteroidetes bacterium]|nr:YicC family protein [Bacteroidota bacterium]MBU1117284.1 YicC family protein [Bacteroidota bacterium]MBU1797376.1 YicC family protein [Bacteroidota bacterium]
MIESMTGYGSSSLLSNRFTIEAEIKSINSRFLDISLRLPRSLNDKEIEIRNLIKQNINRGKVTLNIFLKKDGVENGIPSYDEKILLGIAKLLRKIKSDSDLKEEIQLSDILSFQNILFSDSSEYSEEEYELTKSVILDSIKKLKIMRVEEGEQLVIDLQERVSKIEKLVDEIAEIGRESVKTYFDKLKERAKELIENLSDYTDRLNVELALLSEKYDITEETVRLKSHINQFKLTLKSNVEVGKKLNFVVQEMNREANTINNKSVSLEVSNRGLIIKEELEKIREQVQNIE